MNRKKFKLLTTGRGLPKHHSPPPTKLSGKKRRRNGGFLYSTEGPVKVMIVPRNNRILLRDLSLALSELRAGNEGERETCVQLSQEAKRRGILPPHLLIKDELVWSTYK